MAETVMTIFKTMILVQLFWSFSITLITYSGVLPEDPRLKVQDMAQVISTIDTAEVADDIDSSLTSQTKLPLIDVGALIFYSTNIIIDLILNFLFALPQMFFFIVNSVAQIIGVPYFFQHELQFLASAAILIMYFLGLIQLLTGLRAGRVIN